jgi:hypothetical protein
MTPMLATGPFERLHLVGFLTGALLYGMLLVMVTRPPVRPDAFAFSTGLFGAFSIAEPLLIDVVDGRLQPSAMTLLLTLWAGTALAFPICRRAVSRFVDSIVSKGPITWCSSRTLQTMCSGMTHQRRCWTCV